MKIPFSSYTPIGGFLKEASDSLLPWFEKGKELLGLEDYPLKKLAREVARLSDLLIRGRPGLYMREEWAIRAYFAFFFPQGYLKTYFVLKEMKSLLKERFSPPTITDLGAGLGASMLAASEIFPQAVVKGVESARAAAEFARELTGLPILNKDFTKVNLEGELALAVSSLSEISRPLALAQRLWKGHRCLVVIEPGWSRGYSLIMKLSRKIGPPLLPCGGFPCGLPRNDWCHAALPFRLPELTVRLNSLLRHKLKFLKFTYGVFCKGFSLKGWGVRLRSPLIEEKGKSYYLACSQGKPIKLEFMGKAREDLPQAFCCDLVDFKGREVSPGVFRVEDFRVITSEVMNEEEHQKAQGSGHQVV